VHQRIPSMKQDVTGKMMKDEIKSLGKRLKQTPEKPLVCSLAACGLTASTLCPINGTEQMLCEP
jgi:hypothetical protein